MTNSVSEMNTLSNGSSFPLSMKKSGRDVCQFVLQKRRDQIKPNELKQQLEIKTFDLMLHTKLISFTKIEQTHRFDWRDNRAADLLRYAANRLAIQKKSA